MSLTSPKTIEEWILYQLRTGEQTTSALLGEICRNRGSVTKQGFYAALRKLKAEEAIVVYRQRVALNAAWIKKTQELVEGMASAYIPSMESSDMLALADKESISFIFTTTHHLDVFWGHTQSVIVQRTPVTEPVYSYDPHYWFYIARKATEEKLVRDITAAGRQFLMTVGDSTPLDRAIQQGFNSDELQYHMEKLFPKPEYYLVVIGDYITEVTLDKRVADLVEDVYARSTGIDQITSNNLGRLLNIKARHRIKIARNARKARLLKNKLAKNFFVRK